MFIFLAQQDGAVLGWQATAGDSKMSTLYSAERYVAGRARLGLFRSTSRLLYRGATRVQTPDLKAAEFERLLKMSLQQANRLVGVASQGGFHDCMMFVRTLRWIPGSTPG
jgi:hypothetical protein